MKHLNRIQIDGLKDFILIAESPISWENPGRRLFWRIEDDQLFLEIQYLVPHGFRPEEGLNSVDMKEVEDLLSKNNDLVLTDDGRAWALSKLKRV